MAEARSSCYLAALHPHPPSRPATGPRPRLRIIRGHVLTEAIPFGEVAALVGGYGNFVKAVVDVARRALVVGGELHADDEAILLDWGSRQEDLWGINLYPANDPEDWIEFDSMINIRPRQGNRSLSVENVTTRRLIREVVDSLVVRP